MKVLAAFMGKNPSEGNRYYLLEMSVNGASMICGLVSQVMNMWFGHCYT